ncbi:short-chain dehydrogenase/reductase SDR [Tribonema minus]|uniref:Short-chain dehydrogenase/reductase SDR n=1 Tax=Tribonema minus TaxID=303371 RepID=A0A835YKB8_9STRA|nr:short-chain dehydrogenase/reductase SDR [Tribonema minus]
MQFTGKVAIITGASSGIGLAAAQQLAAEGAKVVLAARGKERLDEAVNNIKASRRMLAVAIGVVMDASVDEDNKRLVDTALETYGLLNVSFINAGVHRAKPISEVDASMLDTLYDVNVKGVAYALKYQLPAIEKSGGKGSVVINSSCLGSTVTAFPIFKGNGPYASTKAAVDILMKYAAIEAIDHGTRVNSIAAGAVFTNLVGAPEEAFEEMGKMVGLMPRAGRPEEIARCVCFLASDEASFVTGTVLTADGGSSLKGP